jgi:hypothetical protein
MNCDEHSGSITNVVSRPLAGVEYSLQLQAMDAVSSSMKAELIIWAWGPKA